MHPRYTEHPTYIDNSEQLAQLCRQWSNCSVIALDTEFIRTDTFYPIGALIQVSDDKGCFLIDPLSIDDFQPLRDLLANQAVTKVLHSCSEDLEVFDRLLGVLPQPIFDTQIAAALDGQGFSLSYQRLTEVLLNIHVPKGETRSDWLQRPLSDSQIHYAALDVAYLPSLYRLLSESLLQKQRQQWLTEECKELIDNYGVNTATEHYYRRIKSAWKLSGQPLALLQTLTQWREKMAREKDRPRGRILKDNSCFDIARIQPDSLHKLAAIADVGPKTVRNYGEQILQMIRDSKESRDYPSRLPSPLPATSRELGKALKAHVHRRAGQLQIAEEMLARKKDFEALIRSGLQGGNYELPASLCGWRKTVIGDELLEVARRFC